MNWIQSYEEFYEFLAKVLLCAPDDFPEEDYLPADKQLNLGRAYEEMSKGLVYVRQRLGDQEYRQFVHDLNESRAAYELGDEKRGASLIQKLRQDLT